MGDHNPSYTTPNIEYQNIIGAYEGKQYAELDRYGPIIISQAFREIGPFDQLGMFLDDVSIDFD